MTIEARIRTGKCSATLIYTAPTEAHMLLIADAVQFDDDVELFDTDPDDEEEEI